MNKKRIKKMEQRLFLLENGCWDSPQIKMILERVKILTSKMEDIKFQASCLHENLYIVLDNYVTSTYMWKCKRCGALVKEATEREYKLNRLLEAQRELKEYEKNTRRSR